MEFGGNVVYSSHWSLGYRRATRGEDGQGMMIAEVLNGTVANNTCLRAESQRDSISIGWRTVIDGRGPAERISNDMNADTHRRLRGA